MIMGPFDRGPFGPTGPFIPQGLPTMPRRPMDNTGPVGQVMPNQSPQREMNPQKMKMRNRMREGMGGLNFMGQMPQQMQPMQPKFDPTQPQYPGMGMGMGLGPRSPYGY